MAPSGVPAIQAHKRAVAAGILQSCTGVSVRVMLLLQSEQGAGHGPTRSESGVLFQGKGSSKV